MAQFICQECGVSYERRTWKNRKSSRFCSNECKAKQVKTWVKGNPLGFKWETATEEEKFQRLKERFEKNVIKKEGCWDWKGSLNWRGYGRVNYNSKSTHKSAHIVSWMINRGEIPDGMFVCHKCDNKGCVNPDHLFLGTHYENMRDMVYKGRQARGNNCPRSKLTEVQVKEIKELLASGEKPKDIAEKFGVTKEAISYINVGKNWKHVPWPEWYKGYKRIAGLQKLTEDTVKEIKIMLNKGVKGSVIARKFGISKSNVSSIRNGLSWKHVEA